MSDCALGRGLEVEEGLGGWEDIFGERGKGGQRVQGRQGIVY